MIRSLICTLFVSITVLMSPSWGVCEEVVVYTALDRPFSEPILKRFEQETGIIVKAVYDAESTKTIGLVNKIRAEQKRPRCDLFWNNEIVNTIRLKSEGILRAYVPTNAAQFPDQFKDPQGYWHGFAARARVLLVNTELLTPKDYPSSIHDLIKPAYRQQIGIAKPLFGTTASHIACLYDRLGEREVHLWLERLKANKVRVMSGNKSCAQAVGSGILACGLTDTDDAIIELKAGKPVKILYLDSKPGELGTLFLPNTIGLIKGSPNPKAAEALADYLLTKQVEGLLASGSSAQIPLNVEYEGPTQVLTPRDIQPMEVDLNKAAMHMDAAAEHIKRHFLR